MNRNNLRRDILGRRDTLADQDIVAKSEAITNRLLDLRLLLDARLVFSYVHFRSEVRTMELIRLLLARGHDVAVPYTVREQSRLLAVRITDPLRQLQPGYCGILEPGPQVVRQHVCEPGAIDLALVPGSVFDPSGGRLGYGGGYYDRFLGTEAPKAVRVGLAYELQMVAQVPLEQHDQFMDFVLTEKQFYDCGRKRYAPDSRLSR